MMLCFEKMCRLFRWFHSLIRKKRRLELALVGLDNAGKTTFTNFIETGRFLEHSMSTIGFQFKKVVRSKCIIKICDLGGLTRFRSIWSRYCTGMDAIIFMLDAQNPTRFEQAKWELEQLMNSTRLEGIPLLVLTNKMDNDEGNAPKIGMEEMAEQLNLLKIGNERAVGFIPISCKKGRNIDAHPQSVAAEGDSSSSNHQQHENKNELKILKMKTSAEFNGVFHKFHLELSFDKEIYLRLSVVFKFRNSKNARNNIKPLNLPLYALPWLRDQMIEMMDEHNRKETIEKEAQRIGSNF